MALKLSNKQRRRLRKILITIGIFFALALVAVCMYAPFFRITGVSIQGARHTDVQALEQDIQSLIHGYRYGIVPNENIFLYQKKHLEDVIVQTYPSVEAVTLSLDIHRQLIIHIKDRKPLGVWCEDECYLYDTAGVIFKRSFTYTGPLFVSWKRDVSSPIHMLDTVSCQGLCTDPVFVDFLREYRVEKAVLHENMLELMSADGYTIKSGFVASTTMAHMRDVVENKPDILKNLEYIDVRFDNKLFYKER